MCKKGIFESNYAMEEGWIWIKWWGRLNSITKLQDLIV